jgi:hypothetical protein
MGRLGNWRFLALTVTTLAVAGMVTPVRAQDPDDLKRGVARISLMNGEVSVRRGDSGEWVAGVINAPLLADDRVATGPNSRAEIQFDASNVLRLGANGELRLTQLEEGRSQMELARGVVTYRVLRITGSNVEIDTPGISVRPSRQGSFRISVNEAGETEVTARGGDVEVFSPRGSQWVHNGQTMMARGAATDPEFQVVAAGGMDEWDRWSDSRDRLMTQSQSARYVGPGVYGSEDLDTAGSWTSVPEYGNVWRPTVGPDWAPYQAGRWVYEPWYGWTWVSSDPWGWAPYHYGRWFHQDRLGWCWYPGLITARSYWSPALVGFFGFGHGVGIGFGFGNVGWVPLAPFEVFRPWWGRGFNGNRGFGNVANINITNNFRNSRFANGVHAVSANDFQSGRFNNVARLNGNQVGIAGAIHGQMPTPGAGSMRFSDRQASVAPRSNDNARFFRSQQPTPAQRSTVNQGANQGTSRTPGAAAVGQARANGAAQSNEAGGWRRFGSPSGQAAGAGQGNQPAANRAGQNNGQSNGQNVGQAVRNDRPAAGSQGSSQGNQGGWQRFGTPSSPNSAAPRQAPAAPRQNYQANPNNGGGSGSLRIAPPVVRERQSAPSNSAPRQSAPAPRSSGGGQSSGGGGSRPSGGSGSGSRGGHGR